MSCNWWTNRSSIDAMSLEKRPMIATPYDLDVRDSGCDQVAAFATRRFPRAALNPTVFEQFWL
jgi:hypothetical protein